MNIFRKQLDRKIKKQVLTVFIPLYRFPDDNN